MRGVSKRGAERTRHQLQRLRECLADAWQTGRTTAVIHRIEDSMRRRWRRLDQTQRRDEPPQPA